MLPTGGNLEINIALGAAAQSAEAVAFRRLFAAGERLDPSEDEWEPESDQEELARSELPWSFSDCLLDPIPPTVIVRFAPEKTPEKWSISLPHPDGRILTTRNSMAEEAQACGDELPPRGR